MAKYAILRTVRGATPRGVLGFSLAPNGFYNGVIHPAVSAPSSDPPELRIDVADLTPGDLRSLARDPEVAGLAPNMPTKLVRAFDAHATAPASAWGIEAVGADRSACDGDGVAVAVLDTGIDAGHAAFAGVELVQRDFTGSGDGDGQGHGTHCAGTLFGRDVAGTRIGVARGVKRAFIGKVLSSDGSGQSSWIFEAINWALGQNAKVISMSLGFDFPGLQKRLQSDGWPEELATSAALEAYRYNLHMFDALMGFVRARDGADGGAVVVAAAGNESHREIKPQYEVAASLPAAAEGVLSVGAVQRNGADGFVVATFSNTLPEVSAPGVDILSAKAGGGLRGLSGTSMATPHVAGVAALWWQALASAQVPVNARNVVARIRASARANVFAPSVDVADRGVGIVAAPL